MEIKRNRLLKRKTKRVLLILCATVALFVLACFVFRGSIVNHILRSKIDSFNKVYDAVLTVDKAEVHGISSVELTGLLLMPAGGDTLFKAGRALADFSFLKLLTGKVALTDFRLHDTYITLVARDSANNYTFLLNKKSNDSDDTIEAPAVNYAGRAESLLDAIFDKIPSTLNIQNFNISSKIKEHYFSLEVADFTIEDNRFKSFISVTEFDTVRKWTVEGMLDKPNRTANFKLFCTGTEKLTIPYMRWKWKADLSFDTLRFGFEEKPGAGVLQLHGYASIDGLEVSNEKISKKKVVFDHLQINYRFNIGRDYYELDSATNVVFNKLDFNPYIKYIPRPSKNLTLILNKMKFRAQDLFESLPGGMFTVLDGMKTQGELSYHLKFIADLADPDSLLFESDLKRHNFRIIKFGECPLTKMNEPFLYTAYEKGKAVRTFAVGPENSDFRPISQISDYLKNCIITSEDGGFYQHQGFLIDAIKEAIAADIKRKAFVRGGSTISMQLVKNVFLNRNKTIARKVEEILITWLIETNRLSSKDRMFEVYLNIIEWGPMVYGANEASRFYFRKDARDLTLAESIFLASIIPKPKWFKYSFDETGHLRDYVKEYYKFVSQKMLGHERITQKDMDNLIPDVELTGPAKNLVIVADSLAGDSVEVE